MDVGAAVKKAKEHFASVFGGEYVAGPRLEEVWLDQDAGVWFVTLGIIRKTEGFGGIAQINEIFGSRYRDGDFQYKTVKISNETGEVQAIQSRELIVDAAE